MFYSRDDFNFFVFVIFKSCLSSRLRDKKFLGRENLSIQKILDKIKHVFFLWKKKAFSEENSFFFNWLLNGKNIIPEVLLSILT